MGDDKIALLDLTMVELVGFLRSLGHPDFRARQVYDWIYRQRVLDCARMTNLPKALRQQLADSATLSPGELVAESVAADGLTSKSLLRLCDGATVETVLMRYAEAEGGDGRRAICVSSQVGCPVGCVFCATGQSGFVRHLTAGEIVGQVLHFAVRLAAEGYERPVTHVVFMGQGEPLLNLEQVKRAVEILNSPYGLNLGARHVTISTAGVVPGISELARWPLQIGLAVSLHAPDDELRTRLVPLNRKYSIATVLAACRDYVARSGRRVTFEYALIDHVNDAPPQARALAQRLRGLNCHVNLIPMNATPGYELQPSPRRRVLAFQQELSRQGIACTVRVERGADIEAACGQLRRRASSDASV